MISRHWETGKMEWQERSKEGEILKGSNIFRRKLYKAKNIRYLRKKELENAYKLT